MGQKKTLKEIALELLALYEQSEAIVICECSGKIEEDLNKLSNECDKYRKIIEEA